MYNDNLFHNSRHVCDMTHSFLYFVNKSILKEHVFPLELHASLIAALCHDVGHPGLSNLFLITVGDPLAMRYNDLSVL
jgi:hypothetical protein